MKWVVLKLPKVADLFNLFIVKNLKIIQMPEKEKFILRVGQAGIG